MRGRLSRGLACGARAPAGRARGFEDVFGEGGHGVGVVHGVAFHFEAFGDDGGAQILGALFNGVDGPAKMFVFPVAGGKGGHLAALEVHLVEFVKQRGEVVLHFQVVRAPGRAAHEHGVVTVGQIVRRGFGSVEQLHVVPGRADKLRELLGDAFRVARAGTVENENLAHEANSSRHGRGLKLKSIFTKEVKTFVLAVKGISRRDFIRGCGPVPGQPGGVRRLPALAQGLGLMPGGSVRGPMRRPPAHLFDSGPRRRRGGRVSCRGAGLPADTVWNLL